MLCIGCGKWVHRRCSGLRNALHAKTMSMSAPHVIDLMEGRSGARTHFPSLGPGLEDVIEEVETFTYLGDIVDRDGEVERAVR